ncbi:glycosyltransferase family 2 protein [Xanthomarina sp. F2636L]|uniref:glycosyltransferase family 2 protein n=1 Tax=Xanthomarina sp. F2636L TaxID=2996018 RepID=UPI00225E4444|nr:glycosyltransferase family 2 protein [Xanthomarina sp. F2636L]MCX7549371.1 glycosyltransferase family 2 protein [Xanthomarina sp. F2636L]
MKLSILIPVFNGEPFIRKSYQSILNQNLQAIDYEIVYINNNSTDQTVAIIKELMTQDPRVKIYHQTNQGEAYARNMGIEKAMGTYIYQLDVDDEIYSGALKRLIYVLDTHPEIEAVFGKTLKSNHTIANTVKPTDETHEVLLKKPPYWGIHWLKSLSKVAGVPCFLYRKEVFKKVGKYHEELKVGTDTGFDVRLGMTCNLAFIDTYIFLYYIHPNSVMSQVKKKNEMIFHTWKRFVKDHLVFYLSHEVPFEFKKRLFRQLFAMMGKQIVYSEDFNTRKAIKKQLIQEIKPVRVPWFLKTYLTILVYLPFKPFLKFYVYYLSRWYVDRNLNTGFIYNNI